MTPLTCILLDDEAGNLQLLKNMLAMHCPQLTILAAETNAEQGIQQISALRPQIVFLDIEMPRMNGFETLRKLEPVNFEVIFVTAFGKYAVQAFEHHAAGYVTKPVQAEKLQAAVNAATSRIEQKNVNKHLFSLLEQSSRDTAPEKIPLSTTNGLVFVKISEIMYCESSGNYTNFILQDDKKIVVSRQLGEYEKLLPENNFTRIHDKYIINLSFIKEYIKGSGGEVIPENGKELPVASRRKEDFLSLFEKWLRRKA